MIALLQRVASETAKLPTLIDNWETGATQRSPKAWELGGQYRDAPVRLSTEM